MLQGLTKSASARSTASRHYRSERCHFVSRGGQPLAGVSSFSAAAGIV